MSALPPPGRTGVRIAGDKYQWLIAWQRCISVLHDASVRVPNPIVSVGVEQDAVGNLDDVVLYRAAPPHTYAQVKYAVDSTTPVNSHYLLAPSSSGGPSILNKIAKAWRQLTAESASVDLALITNRAPDPNDPLIALRDSRTQLLMPKAGQLGPASLRGQARARWALGAGLSEQELLQLLSCLHFDISRDPIHLYKLVQHMMLAAGLRHDQAAVDAGADWVACQVRDGHRVLTAQMIRSGIQELGLQAGPTRAVLSIATLKPDPMASCADYALDWTDRFEGVTAYSKRRPQPPATWAQLQEQIEAAPGRLPPGTSAVAVTGSLRQAPAFLLGSAFRMVTGADLAGLHRGQLWSTAEPYDTVLQPLQSEHTIGQGPDLAIAVAVAVDPTEDVLDFLRAQETPVSHLLVLLSPTGVKDNAVLDAAAANALAIGIRNAARRASRAAPRIHLFLAGPMRLAMMLGHRWNRVRPTVVYEDVATAQFYEQAFSIDA